MSESFRIHDPQRGPFDPTIRRMDGPYRPGKTREDRMIVALRPRVQAASARLKAARA